MELNYKLKVDMLLAFTRSIATKKKKAKLITYILRSIAIALLVVGIIIYCFSPLVLFSRGTQYSKH